ncbi:MAG: hypothetical protein H7315_15375 [Herminiimonas sp.]|nr:hypothetical protein [Herminiimonas sp.]
MMRWTVAMVAAMGVCIAAAMAVLGGVAGGELPLTRITSWLATSRSYVSFIHLALLACLWWKWEALVNYFYATGRMTPEMKLAALGSRNRTLMLLLAFELFVVIGFPFAVIRLWQ